MTVWGNTSILFFFIVRLIILFMLSRNQPFVIPWTVALQTPVHGIFQQGYQSVCHFLLQGIFPTQGSKPGLQCLLHCQVHSLPLSHPGSPTVCHHRFISFNKGTLLWGMLVMGEAKHVAKHVPGISLCLPFNFTVNLNCLKKIKS